MCNDENRKPAKFINHQSYISLIKLPHEGHGDRAGNVLRLSAHGAHGIHAREHEAHADQQEDHAPKHVKRSEADMEVLAENRVPAPGKTHENDAADDRAAGENAQEHRDPEIRDEIDEIDAHQERVEQGEEQQERG